MPSFAAPPNTPRRVDRLAIALAIDFFMTTSVGNTKLEPGAKWTATYAAGPPSLQDHAVENEIVQVCNELVRFANRNVIGFRNLSAAPHRCKRSFFSLID
jgi:hypothetical protein